MGGARRRLADLGTVVQRRHGAELPDGELLLIEAAAALTELEMEGRARSLSGGYAARIDDK